MRIKELELILIIICALSSCTKHTEGESLNKAVFEASVEDAVSKTTLDEARHQLWDASDVIKIFNSDCSSGAEFKITNIYDSGTKASFEGTISGPGPYYSFYPASSALHYASETITFELGQEQIYDDGTFANGINPMIASTVDDTHELSFHNLCGLLAIRLKGNARIKTITLSDNDSDFALWGTAESDSSGNMTISNISDEKHKLILTFPQAIQLDNTGNEFVFVVPEGAFATGFSASVFDADAERIATFGTTKSVNVINRSHIRVMPWRQVYTSKVYTYDDDLTTNDRFLTLGFDDFRTTDFDWVIPMLNEHSAHATFNMIINSYDGASAINVQRVNTAIMGGHEVGDHTVGHHQRWMTMPLLNGQNPEFPDGDQVPFPSNSQFRDDRGDGKNSFGYTLSDTPYNSLGYQAPDINTPWESLSDSQCQDIRNYYSLYGNTTLLAVYDKLSNKYLGTSGSSFGSWDDERECYTQGIFTDCKTSQNHEVWDRIVAIDLAYFKNELGLYDMRTWSLPGSANADFLYYSGGKSFYDSECTKRAWCTARFESSYLLDGGNPKNRSWVEVLREFGYNNSHDMRSMNVSTMMSRGLIYNASLSRYDALPYPRHHNRPVNFYNRAAYTNSFFTGTCSKAQQMYDCRASGENGFYIAIEGLREMCSNGIITCGTTDTDDSETMKNYLEGILDYCDATGVKVINEQEAMDICFNHSLSEGNLIYNPHLRNTAKEFMPEANVPSNPDGYSGSCSVGDDSGTPTLQTSGQVIYRHFGIPLSDIRYIAYAKGTGSIKIYQIRNDSPLNSLDTRFPCGSAEISSSDSFSRYKITFNVPNNPMTEYEQVCEGLGDKVCGIAIVYSSGLEVKNMSLEKYVPGGTAASACNETYGESNGEW